MTQKEIRQQFFDFFKEKKHQLVSSAPVIPQGDPTLLFTNAGMNQFKDILLGLKNPSHLRVVDTQKCIRVSGKHNDLEEVGVDTYHHTFFEMLGNWSFGDYYKREAISWAWELLTEVWHLSKNKLYVTIYLSDDESHYLWKKHTDVDPNRILRFDKQHNFWEMGETGPCGPCSEIHYDKGEGHCNCKNTGRECGVNKCERYIEIWNLVFIEYNRSPNGELEELKKKCIDTGMGFERIVSILQEKNSNYDTDIFSPLIEKIEELCGKEYSKSKKIQEQIAMRVIADHIRAIAFSIADGVTPSNEGRGYVIRRILRRAARYGRNLGLTSPFLHSLIDVLTSHMGEFFPELSAQKIYLKQIILSEEKSFNQTLDRGLKRLEDVFENLEKVTESNGQGEQKIINGKVAFELYDTYGFPCDLTALIASEKGFDVDNKGFEIEMSKQKERSKKNDSSDSSFYLMQILSTLKSPTRYLGDAPHASTEQGQKGKLLLIIKDNKSTSRLKDSEEGILVFDQTPFYAESGGQVGDTGCITISSRQESSTVFVVKDTQKLEGFNLHYGQVTKGVFIVKEECVLQIDQSNRSSTRKNHSATHLLQKALKDVLGDHVKQAGSLVTPTKLRFDFNHFKALTLEEIEKVEEHVNQAIWSNYSVEISNMPMTQAIKKGAIAFFEEKYGEEVRVVNMGSHSIELCGGSHVKTTGEIARFKILAETSVASGIRRIEAITASHAYKLDREKQNLLHQIETILAVGRTDAILEKVKNISNDNKQLTKEIKSLKSSNLKEELKKIKPEMIKDIAFYHAVYEQTDGEPLQEILREKIDQIKNSQRKAIAFFASQNEDKVVFICGVTSDLTFQFKAGDLVKEASQICNGGGGGRADFAQAGGKLPEKIPQALEQVKSIITRTK